MAPGLVLTHVLPSRDSRHPGQAARVPRPRPGPPTAPADLTSGPPGAPCNGRHPGRERTPQLTEVVGGPEAPHLHILLTGGPALEDGGSALQMPSRHVRVGRLGWGGQRRGCPRPPPRGTARVPLPLAPRPPPKSETWGLGAAAMLWPRAPPGHHHPRRPGSCPKLSARGRGTGRIWRCLRGQRCSELTLA